MTEKSQPTLSIVEVPLIPKLEDIKDVPTENLAAICKVCQQLEELCIKESGIGISAVQTGVPWKLFLVRGDGKCSLIPKGKFGYFVNCSYEGVGEEKVISLEGCLSLRDDDGKLRFFEIQRCKKIKVTGFQFFFETEFKLTPVDVELDVFQEGIIFQHEIDHQNYVLISDIGKEVVVY